MHPSIHCLLRCSDSGGLNVQPLEATYYHPERELMGMEMMGVEPSWFYQPVLGFAEVGERIANDIRFQCTITQSLEMLYQQITYRFPTD